MRHLVADMLRVDLNDAGKGLRDPVDAEGLGTFVIRCRGVDDPAVSHFLHEMPVNGVLHVKLVLSVPLLCHSAGNGVGKAADPVGGKIGLRFRKKNRFHRPASFLIPSTSWA